jgi:hypothetical protein
VSALLATRTFARSIALSGRCRLIQFGHVARKTWYWMGMSESLSRSLARSITPTRLELPEEQQLGLEVYFRVVGNNGSWKWVVEKPVARYQHAPIPFVSDPARMTATW